MCELPGHVCCMSQNPSQVLSSETAQHLTGGRLLSGLQEKGVRHTGSSEQGLCVLGVVLPQERLSLPWIAVEMVI